MKLQDTLTIYEQTSTDDGAGGQTPGALVKVNDQWGSVKPLSGMIAMNFQQTYGTQGFEVIIRTDFDFEPDRKYMIQYSGIYGDQLLSIVYPLIDKYYTKFICKSENKRPIQDS